MVIFVPRSADRIGALEDEIAKTGLKPWIDGIVHILRTFAERGAPPPERADWSGRWWTLWAATDLVAAGPKVLRFLEGAL